MEMRMDKKLIIRYILLILGVTIMSLGIALSLKSNALLVIFQMVLLRKITLSQIAQMLVCILFGYMIDFNLSFIDFLNPTNYISQWILLIISCLVLAFGLVIEVKSDITMLPGDGAVVAIGEVLNKDWGKVKPLGFVKEPFFQLLQLVSSFNFTTIFLVKKLIII